MKITSTYSHKPVSLMKKSWKASNCLVRDMKSENLICFLTKIFSIENVSFCSEISTENGKTSEKTVGGEDCYNEEELEVFVLPDSRQER